MTPLKGLSIEEYRVLNKNHRIEAAKRGWY
jgi:hypothetical protein